ncbi:hypothetical protein [Actinosynnema mirum]|uniref:Uncharacterized protein n=1 Tax=Actinosynnema mirum (strain ATCC 29888 / DSM 43827 / JCM 3225 / NBRC 14064 / NCIMB 13271 / NRRL B-12336 / IMRU 3971 / 101) TaxID=446462 RepID=C6W8S4_ACTMD|nr:hypothetical protein [Actinosynnema mirum]ACU37173.1 hypothetical protein Amir_3266 [Actinosynnema mirum DSM 43827]
MTSPADPNGDLLAQLQATAAVGGPTSQADLLAQLNAEPEPDPFGDVEYTGDLATDSTAELDALARGFRERTAREDERFRLATDSEFWFALCFKSREEKDRFLKAARLFHLGDKYLDGLAFAAALGVAMPAPDTGEEK